MARRAAKEQPRWFTGLAGRWKAVVALLVPLVGGLVALYPEDRAWQTVGAVVVAIATAVGVHQTPNRTASPTRKVGGAVDGIVDDVTDLLP